MKRINDLETQIDEMNDKMAKMIKTNNKEKAKQEDTIKELESEVKELEEKVEKLRE